ncbi:MAG: hypothetical protein GEV28_26020 [Actinophytocola sp.]|uniref:hypothetical protein n=1 Tax=Actinophytocola sp. TaxID=1872138 RepID=UPI00132965D5|nr:hypothetical protein [Actinophytocola sp.]MPZ83661.1 hypothetical protein [Actinophytocola sp.]
MRTFPLRGVRWLAVVLPLGLIVGCGARPVDTSAPPGPPIQIAPQSSASLPPTPMPKNPPTEPKVERRGDKRPEAIDARLLAEAAAEVEPNTTLGAFVFDRTTGTTPLAYNADRPFRSASLVKLLIAIDALENGADAEDRERIARMLSLSDDDLASMFWVKDGGVGMVARTAAELGLGGVRPPEVPGQWGEVVVTPRDVAAIYRHVLAMPPEDQALIVKSLGRATPYAADGFDQYFGIPTGLKAQWAIKQGWGNNDEAMVLHSTGLVGPDFRYVVVLLTEHPLGSGWQTSAQSVTAAAMAMTGRLPGI